MLIKVALIATGLIIATIIALLVGVFKAAASSGDGKVRTARTQTSHNLWTGAGIASAVGVPALALATLWVVANVAGIDFNTNANSLTKMIGDFNLTGVVNPNSNAPAPAPAPQSGK